MLKSEETLTRMHVLPLCVLAFLLSLVSAEVGSGVPYCPSNGVTSDNSALYQCLVLFTNTLSWYDALYSCEIIGGSLVKIETEKQNEYINSKIQGSGYYWIGLNDIHTEDQFVWPDQTSYEEREFWKSAQPGGKTRQNCVASEGNGWEDKACTDENKYICQIVSKMTPETSISIPEEAKLSNNRFELIRPKSWNNRALMVSLSVEDESICVLYCLYTENCVRMSYRADKRKINCLLYRDSVGSEAPLWDWRVYERVTAVNDETEPGPIPN